MSEHQFEAEGKSLAAIDLGSNSFHMLVARVEHGEVRPAERLAENVQLAAGLQNRLLNDDAIARGLECLARARGRRSEISSESGAALLAGWQAERILKQAAATPETVVNGTLGTSEARKRLSLMVQSATGRW